MVTSSTTARQLSPKHYGPPAVAVAVAACELVVLNCCHAATIAAKSCPKGMRGGGTVVQRSLEAACGP